MILPPMVLRTQFCQNSNRQFRLWFPLFLLWPVGGLIAAALFPVYVVVAACLYLAGRKEGKMLLMYPHLIPLLICSLRGLRIRVQSKETLIHIEVQ